MRYHTKKQPKDRQLTIYFERVPEELAVAEEAEEILRMAIEATLQYESFSDDAEVSVTFCDGEYIRTLNATYRNKDSETDVLSFPLFDEDEEDPVLGEVVPLGDIVLNLDRAVQQGKELGHSAMREAAFLAVHSTLHLLGYDHMDEGPQKAQMRKREETIAASIPKMTR